MTVDLTSQGVPLKPISGYLVEALGHPATLGTASLKVQAEVKDSQVQADLDLKLLSFAIGSKVEGKGPGIPLELGLALLRDLNNAIRITAPISGDLTDPSVGVGSLIVQVITNSITKVAAAPFKLLAGLVPGVGGEEEVGELNRLAFAAGSAELSAAEAKKVARNVQALSKRPALALLVQGMGDEVNDAAALKRQVIEKQVAQRIRAAANDPAVVNVSDAQYHGAVAMLYVAHFVAADQDGEPAVEKPELQADEALDWSVIDPAALSAEVESSAPTRVGTPGGRRRMGQATERERTVDPEALAASLLPEGVSVAEAERVVMLRIPLEEGAVATLAARRAQAVAALLTKAGLADDRLQIKEAEVGAGPPRVKLDLAPRSLDAPAEP